MSARRSVLALAAALAALGCDPEPSGDNGSSGLDGGSWPMEIGQGEIAFAPLVAGEVLPYVAGTQSGHHVFVAFRMHDLDPMRVLVRVKTTVEGHDELALERSGRIGFESDGLGQDAGVAADAGAGARPSFAYAGWPAQILDAPEHVGTRTRIDVWLEDRNGRRASASETIVIRRPEHPLSTRSRVGRRPWPAASPPLSARAPSRARRSRLRPRTARRVPPRDRSRSA